MIFTEKENEYTMIPVLRKTKERIDRIARKEQTYDEFINILLNHYERGGKK